MKIFLLPCCILLSATVFPTGALSQSYNFLNPLSSFGLNGDGSIRPGDRPYVTTGNFQRGVAYNPVTGNILFIDRAAGGGGSPDISGGIYVLNGATGADVGTLNTNGMAGGSFADFTVGIADDGVVYVANLVNNGTASPFKLYRWPSDASVNPPVVVFSGDPGNGRPQRWGDTMDIRGSGAGIQIILGSRSQGAIIGTNVAILTTVDGVNFTATTLGTDVADSASGGGIAFGAGNTFWAKNVDTPLRLFSFNLGAGQATTLRSYGPDVFASSRTLEALAVNAPSNLLAIVDFAPAADRVRLYDISDTAKSPVLLDIRDFSSSNANGTTTKGYLDFGGGNLYVHSMNNGLLAFFTDARPVSAPIIDVQPSDPGRVLRGRDVIFQVVAYPAVRYQWQRNGINISDATNAVLTLTNVQTSDAGSYRVIVQNSAGSVTSAEAVLSVVNPEDLYHLTALWNATPGVQSYVTSTGGAGTPNERHIAYNALSNQLYVVQRNGNNYTVHVLDASTGTKLYNLKTNGILPVVASEVAGANGIGLVAIDVADDGAIYACNVSPNAGGGSAPFATNKLFRVYRWANSDSNTLPVQIFEGDPAGQSSNFRWGDVLDARGSGLNTQIILDNQNSSARYMTILRPTDATMNAFSTSFFYQDTVTPFGASIGRSLEFGAGDTLWQKRKAAPLIKSSFDFNAFPEISPVEATYSNFPSGIGLVGLDLSRKLLAGINFLTVTTAPDTLDLYDIADPANPLLLAKYNFPINHVANNNFIGRVLFAGNRVFALDGNNGIVAFNVVAGPQNPPTIITQPQDLRIVSGNSSTLSVFTADLATYQWQFYGTNLVDATNSTYVIVNATTNQAGPYRVIVSNDAGSTPSSNAVVTVLPAEGFARLTPCWSLAPLSRSYLVADTDAQGRTPLYRGIAYNALSNQVYVISRTGQTAGLAINVLDATSGADVYQLNVAGISGGTIILLGMAVTADGALYAANMADGPNGGLIYNLYRWADSHPNTAPVLVYSGDPGTTLSPALRWGDTLDARGTGINTEIIIDANAGTLAAILKPTDAAMGEFVPTAFVQNYGGGSIGRSLRFGSNQTFWQKRKGTRLLLSQYDLPTQSSATVTNYPNFPASLGPVDLDLPHNLLAGINFSVPGTPDTLDLYDISDFNNPQRIAGYNFPVNQAPNGNFIGQVLFTGGKVYAVDGNNGIVAFTLVLPSRPLLTIVRSGSNVILSWPTSAAGFVLQKNSALSPAGWTDVTQTPSIMGGQYTVTEDASSGNGFYRLRKP